MSDDPLIGQLTRFTPDGSGLDRDALLFAAGKASSRPSRRWQALAGALAASQLLTVGLLLWPGQAPSTPVHRQLRQISTAAHDIKWIGKLEPQPEPSAPGPSAAWELRERMFSEEGFSSVSTFSEPIDPDEAPLRAFGSPPAALLN